METLKDLYLDQLQDIHSACKQSRDVTIELEEAATDEELKKALHAGHRGISDGMESLESLIQRHGADPRGEHCKGMEGLVKEARAHALEENFGDDEVRDAMIITQYQRMAHYAIAGYGCVKAFTTPLELWEDSQKLDEHLQNTREGDERMTELAMRRINRDAKAS